MSYYKIWASDDGESHLQEVEVEFMAVGNYALGVPPVDVSEAMAAGEVHFSSLSPGWFGDWHPAPSRQFVVLLQGTLEVTTSDGSMTGGPGTVWLIEDLSGRGHQTRVIGNEDAIRLSVTLINESGV